MSKQRAPEPLLDRHGLYAEEVGALWAFLHGDIVIGDIRRRIREHWGLCSRHAWGHAVVEIELWEQGAGARHGHQPFDVGVLYADLLDGVSHQPGRSGHSHRRALERRGSCYVCQQLTMSAEQAKHQIGYAGFDSSRLGEEANRFSYTHGWLDETVELWRRQLCPRCSVGGTGVLCRRHLRDSDPDGSTALSTAEYLDQFRDRLTTLTGSMAEGGEPSTPEADASWIETLGWFHTWSFPIDLTTLPRT